VQACFRLDLYFGSFVGAIERIEARLLEFGDLETSSFVS